MNTEKRLILKPDRSESPTAVEPDPLPEAGHIYMRDLGEPLSIRQVAHLIGCSVWSVRQTLIPMGLPHFRSAPSGKLIFYRDQVVRWIVEQQTKGGQRP